VHRVTVAALQPRPRRAVGIASAIIAVGLLGLVPADWSDVDPLLTVVLIAISIGSWLTAPSFTGNTVVSPAFLAPMLALAFLGPAGAFLVPLAGEVGSWLVLRYRWRAALINIAGSATPTLVVAWGFAAVGPSQESVAFFVLLALATAVMWALNTLIVVPLMNVLDGIQPVWPDPETELELLPTIGISAALTVVVAEAYAQWGYGGLALAVLVIAIVSYMERLIGRSREQTRQYANLSWGILSSLVRALDERDHRAARHCAAVAMFSRDIAELVGMDAHEQELAHTAGLLHDIGKFTLSDRVMERGAQLDDADWRGIRRHPDIGADLLQDIGVFGPVGEIVRCHHERLDGRGYPRGLTAEDIPEVAKIVAVAEVYDTLTAPDTYRTPMNSFEALNELRRVAGSQLEGRYVDALATLLAGRGTDYRHQDEADFDRELDMERRMSEAATPA
jgi:putative nucleotidyltransferase with HDIG domain